MKKRKVKSKTKSLKCKYVGINLSYPSKEHGRSNIIFFIHRDDVVIVGDMLINGAIHITLPDDFNPKNYGGVNINAVISDMKF